MGAFLLSLSVRAVCIYLEYSGSFEIEPASSFWIASASLAVTPSPGSKQSAFAAPSGLSAYLSLFAMDWSIATASATDTFLSRFASPIRFAEGAVVVSVSETVVVVVVVAEAVVVAFVVVVTISGISMPSVILK